LTMCAIPERINRRFVWRRYTNLPLPVKNVCLWCFLVYLKNCHKFLARQPASQKLEKFVLRALFHHGGYCYSKLTEFAINKWNAFAHC